MTSPLTKVGIVGASGYTGEELVRVLARHPRVRLAAAMVVAHSDRPLRLFAGLGLAMAASALAYGMVLVARALAGQIVVQGYASLMASIYFIGGLVLAVQGIAGIYIGILGKK